MSVSEGASLARSSRPGGDKQDSAKDGRPGFRSVRKEEEEQRSEEKRSLLPIFPEPVRGEISSEEFLEAAGRVVGMLDYFGKLFMPVKYDMQGNINKLIKKMNLDRQNHVTLQKMLMSEKEKMESPVAIDALMWLRRGLHMIQLFFEYIVTDYVAGQRSEDLVAYLKKSYELSLEPYHGYMVQQLFGILSRMIPSRTQIFRAITNGCEVEQEIIITNIDRFCRRLKENVTTLKNFYDEHDLENNYKV